MNKLNEKIAALAKYQKETDLSGYREEYGEIVCPDDTRWMVYTDAEADEAVSNYIADSLWAFNADFILKHCDTVDESDREVVAKSLLSMQGKLCESANGICLALIGGKAGLPQFVEDAVDADGRGHFLSDWDGEEVELGGGFFGYRVG